MRRMTMSVLLLVVLTTLFAGCRASTLVPMHQDAPAKIPSTDVIIGLNQEEIYAEYEQSRISQGTGGGLLFALIDVAVDSSRSTTAETIVTPVRNAMNGYSFDAELQKSMQEGLGKIDWMHVSSVKLEQPCNDELRNKILESSSSGAVLIANLRYYLTPDLATLKISMQVSVYPISVDLKTLAIQLNPTADPPPPALLYRNELTFFYPLRGKYEDKDKASQAWCADSGKLIRSAMAEGIAEMTRMLVLDLETARAQAREKDHKTTTGKEVMYDGISGTMVAETPNRVVYRLLTGALFSVPQELIQ